MDGYETNYLLDVNAFTTLTTRSLAPLSGAGTMGAGLEIPFGLAEGEDGAREQAEGALPGGHEAV